MSAVPGVRVATRDDVEALHRVRLAVRENVLSRPELVTHADYVEHLELRGRGWLAEVRGEVVGFAIGRADDGNVWALFVDPAHEGRGIGGALHDVLVEWMFAQGLECLWLTTGPATRAEGFYRRRGWREAGRVGEELRLELARADFRRKQGLTAPRK
jgi:GNAT superfamily N-acetyltransferase